MLYIIDIQIILCMFSALHIFIYTSCAYMMKISHGFRKSDFRLKQRLLRQHINQLGRK